MEGAVEGAVEGVVVVVQRVRLVHLSKERKCSPLSVTLW